MEFEWDEEKRRLNLDKLGVDLLRAARIFRGKIVTMPDLRFDYGEERFLSIGMVEDEILVVVHTERAEKIRLISARKGGRKDRGRYSKRNT